MQEPNEEQIFNRKFKVTSKKWVKDQDEWLEDQDIDKFLKVIQEKRNQEKQNDVIESKKFKKRKMK